MLPKNKPDMGYTLDFILRQFQTKASINPYGNGHINDTYLVSDNPKYILQRINTSIFKQPERVMDNIAAVTEHLRVKIEQAGGDPDRETLTLVKTHDGKNFYKADDDNCFRLYYFIDNAVSYDKVENPVQFYNAAKAFGRFQNMLSDFPAEKLFETIPEFHNTGRRFEALEAAVREDRCGRAIEVQPEIEFAFARRRDTSVITDAIKDGTVPLRVTHNDTKLNNVMLDSDTNEGVCVIDLDTVMPGSMLYDYGDALRFGASSAAEDERDLSLVWFDLGLYESFTKGFIEELLPSLTKREIELMPSSVKLMTYECGIRFLTDYLNGDTYFKIHREKHNIDRARTQLKLVADIEQKMDRMSAIVSRIQKDIFDGSKR